MGGTSPFEIKKNLFFEAWQCSSVVECVLSMCEALDPIPSIKKLFGKKDHILYIIMMDRHHYTIVQTHGMNNTRQE